MAELSFRYEPYDDWHCKLVAVVEAHGFKGRGEAYFSHTDVKRFVDHTANYPLSLTELPRLIYGSDDERALNTSLKNFGVTIFPYDGTGTLCAAVELASSGLDFGSKDLQDAVTVRFLLRYNDLLSLQSFYYLIIKDTVGEVLLSSTYST